jgi:cellobiose-specific phosphotransferase system component IIC
MANAAIADMIGLNVFCLFFVRLFFFSGLHEANKQPTATATAIEIVIVDAEAKATTKPSTSVDVAVDPAVVVVVVVVGGHGFAFTVTIRVNDGLKKVPDLVVSSRTARTRNVFDASAGT